LDAKLRITARGFLKRLQKDLGVTSIYVTHDQEEAATIADEIVVLNNGKVQQIGPPETLYNKPQNIFVAGFIGSPPMNMIEGRVLKKDDKIFFNSESLDFEIPQEVMQNRVTNEELEKGKNVILGIRPENVLAIATPGDYARKFKGKVYITELVGNIKYIMIEVGKVTLRAVADPNFQANIGEEIYFTFNPQKFHFFDSETQRRI
jgi:multiple sugar transport system ATP-binding protein